MRFPRLLVAVLSAVALVAGPAVSSMAAAAPAVSALNWSSSAGNCSGSMASISPSSATAGVQLSYALDSTCIYGNPQTWTFRTIAPATETLTFDWTYTGFHAYFGVTAFLNAFSDGPGGSTESLVNVAAAQCCTAPSGGFTYSGTATIRVTKGYAFGIRVGGDNFDSNATLQGTVTLSLPSGAACKDGGWQRQPLLLFRNQGTCVSEFATSHLTPIGS